MTETTLKRDYENAPGFVKALYFGMHTQQTVGMVQMLQANVFGGNGVHRYSIREMFELGKSLVDTSDPDSLSVQSIHWMQTALALLDSGACSADITGGFFHDMGKVMLHSFYGVTGPFNWGDTFIVGCRHDADAIETIDAAPDAFALNPDSENSAYNTQYGMYEKACGLDDLLVSFGHDEAIYHAMVVNMERGDFKKELPKGILDFFRWHSCYPLHTGTPKKAVGYEHLLCDADRDRLKQVKRLSGFDLYSKDVVKDPEEELYSRLEEVLVHVDVFVDPDIKLRW
jgi:inositol oxygenase